MSVLCSVVSKIALFLEYAVPMASNIRSPSTLRYRSLVDFSLNNQTQKWRAGIWPRVETARHTLRKDCLHRHPHELEKALFNEFTCILGYEIESAVSLEARTFLAPTHHGMSASLPDPRGYETETR